MHLDVLKDQFTVAKKEGRESKRWILSEKKERHYNLTCYVHDLKTWKSLATDVQIQKLIFLCEVKFRVLIKD